MEWMDTSKQAKYNEQEKTWTQHISWKEHGEIFDAIVVYKYEDETFQLTFSFDEIASTPEHLFNQQDFTAHLSAQKALFDTLRPFLFSTNRTFKEVSIQKEAKFAKEIQFKTEPNLTFTAYVSKTINWHLDDLSLQVNNQRHHYLLQETALEEEIEEMLEKHLV